MPRFTGLVFGTAVEIAIAVAIIVFIGRMLNKREVKMSRIANDGESPLRLVCRVDWEATAPKTKIPQLNFPVTRVVISHTATGECDNKELCIKEIKKLQTHQMDNMQLPDIAFNFLIGGDARVYVGRGWYNQSSLTEEPANTIDIAFVGKYDTRQPSTEMLDMGKKLINETVSMGKIATDYKVFGAREIYTTDSPGDRLFQLIQRWPNYSKQTPPIPDLSTKKPGGEA